MKRAALAALCRAFQAEMDAVKARYIKELKVDVAAAKDSHAALTGLIAQSPELFKKPRSVVSARREARLSEGQGKDGDRGRGQDRRPHQEALRRAGRGAHHHPRSPRRSARQLAVADLKKVAVVVTDTGDVVFAKDTTAEVDKLVAAFLKDESDEDTVDEPQRAAA
jgi:hypothetical protein